MKFGQNLPRNQVPEWASQYIDYKALKKLIKAARKESEQHGVEEPDLAEFFYTLDRQLEDIDTFYNRKYAEFSRRLRLLFDRYGMASKLKDGMDRDDMDDLMGALLELRGQYRNLQWYGEVNRRGFVKITKKLDKKIASSTTQSRYLATKVDPKAFATNNKLTLDMRAINDWLSQLGEVKVVDDASSVHSGSSSGSIHRMGSRTTLKIPTAALEAMESAVKEEDTTRLFLLVSKNAPEVGAQKALLLDLLQRAIAFKAFNSIEAILREVPSIDPDNDLNKRNCLHKLIISIGRVRASKDAGGFQEISKATAFINAAQPPVRAPGAFKVEERDPENDLSRDVEAERLLAFVLDHLKEEHHQSALSKDVYGRMPLHYAAQYGLVFASQMVMKHLQQWNLFDVSEGIDAPQWQDLDGFAPLHLAVIAGHYRSCKALLLVDDWHKFTDHRLTSKHVEKSGMSLELATKSNFHKIVGLLVDAGVDVNFRDDLGETALHVAARFGHEECARALLAATSGDNRINLEIAEKEYGWTPLFIASVNGHLSIAKLLVDAGAQVNKLDSSLWTPQEHAALRGHIELAKYIASLTPPPSLHASPELAAQAKLSSSPPAASSLEDRRSHGVPKEELRARVPEPVKSFGHRYLTEETMVLVSLGTLGEHKDLQPINLENIAINDAHATQLDTALSLVVTAHGASGEPTVIDLPIQEDISTSPITFMTKDPSKVKLLFDLVPTYSGATDKRIARAVALLSSIKPGVGNKRSTLQTDMSVPLLAGPDFDVIGSINFNFLIITPFKHPNISIDEQKTYWTKSSTKVIGHRGLGKNMATKTSLQLGENTIQSFITAANLGASYVEFDVQMTKDHVPVIYHDFLVSETGADVPVHTLTLEQFLALSDTPKPTRPSSPAETNGKSRSRDNREPPGRIQRSYSVGAPLDARGSERMKNTRDFKTKGYKGNMRGEFIQQPFTTLEEMFTTIPEDVGFNIEMKYPMLFETVQEEMDTYAVELNTFVDTVLQLVYNRRKGRNIVFSSFHPDICLLLTFKQPSIPVLFLTDAGVSPVGDIRAGSLQEAIRFASRWSLLGIVSAAEPFVLCPRLINVVQSSGLVCVSYGTLNNDPHNSNLQAQAGIDAVIVDSVARVRKGLTDADAERNGSSETKLLETRPAGAVTNGQVKEMGEEMMEKLKV
ncbi:Glycerophosphocholine phosphodiesterase GDE1 [Fulvia fulva]|uniref:Glycerophosphocholine phosphodiesterase GDE1 n=1 Tax=Passalora fulva TaxID=5499 RepID=A0A9Q8PFC2_PASFU|nr:Glycerophosphocholine phosphodiesterase GDE1 [Fulvia fulva]KAK4618653.1 Glycerophosphocholine phosphodiesterase GDE1 [Fulvia fulva]UJO21382.1 Glycerophosphocholine phosphodiesterase GDE1 [Fulvia fulva]WPV33268.1 Glycerophosphocholine phosphodiesterase GDE1 [Fulvia fulva]